MATYQDAEYLTNLPHSAFDETYEAGSVAPFSGIYRCMGCHIEITSEVGSALSSLHHPQHRPDQGKIRWRLIAYADHRPK